MIIGTMIDMLRAVAVITDKKIKNEQRKSGGTARGLDVAHQGMRPPITLLLTHQHDLKPDIGT